MTALVPFRLRVLRALTACLKTITPANGYQSNLSDFLPDDAETADLQSRVFRGRDQFGFNDPRPMVSILEHPRAIDALLAPNNHPERVGEWDILIQGFVTDDPENPTDPAHMLVADVQAALAKEAARRLAGRAPDILGLGASCPCVTKLAIGSPVCRPADGEISDVAFFFLTVTLTLAEDASQPFA